jgi:DNA-binding response OmpR family regulator
MRACSAFSVAVDTRAVSVNDLTVELTPREFAIFQALRLGVALNSDALVDRIYAADPDGGPLFGRACVHIHVMNMRRKLTTIGLTVESRKGRGSWYRLQGPQ